MNESVSSQGLARLAYLEAIGDIHRQFIDGVMALFDGFLGNAEDALFEEAHRTRDPLEREACANLLRSLREDDPSLRRVFGSMLQRFGKDWLAERTGDGRFDDAETDALAIRLAEKSTNHMSGMLRLILDRYNAVSGHEMDSLHSIPVSPYRIAIAWCVSAQVRYPDPTGVAMLGRIFERFVLSRLNALYGQMQLRLARIVVLEGESENPASSAA